MNIRVLPSARARTASSNLASLIQKARISGALGEVVFDDPMWIVKLSKKKRPSSGRVSVDRLYFTEVKAGGRGIKDRTPLQNPFATFLKALVRLREADAGRHLDDHATIIRAGRYLHDTMSNIEYDPCRLTVDHFLEAAKASRAADSASTAYALGKKLVEISRWIDRFNVAMIVIGYQNSNARADDSNARIGKEAEARREAKLPSEAALNTLASLANVVVEDADVLRMRIIELLVCGGWRINELLSIPAECEVEDPAVENGEPLVDAGGNRVVRYGIRYDGEKGAPPAVKWVPTPMVDVAKRAIADIRRITQPTRDAAAWAANNPGRIMVPGFMVEDLHQRIVLRELEVALGLSEQSGLQWCRTKNIPCAEGFRSSVEKRDVAAAIIADMPHIPIGGRLRLEDYLFLVPTNYFHETRASITGSVRFVTDGMVAAFIGGHSETKSVFTRFGYENVDGAPIRMNSHQFRHWLNTLAQQGGMGELEIARWSGRKDIGQNAAYDHVSGVELAKRLRALVSAGSAKGSIAKAYDKMPLRYRAEFLDAEIATAHVTAIGVCVHDWSLLPCANHGACAGCDEHVVLRETNVNDMRPSD